MAISLSSFNFHCVGLDVAAVAVKNCEAIFKDDAAKSFFVYEHAAFNSNLLLYKAELALSLDVIYHLVEDDAFENFLNDMFLCSERFVIIYAWDVTGTQGFM